MISESLFPPRRCPSARVAGRRGSVYVAVLGVAMIVAILGLAALAAVRIQRSATEGANDAVAARHYAESAVDVVLQRLNTDPNWRTAYANDTWTADENLVKATFSYKLVDEQDGDLANDDSQPVRLYTRSTIGDALRIVSVQLTPPDRPNLLTNPGIEDGTTGWTGDGIWDTATVGLDTSEPHTGTACLAITNRASIYGGPSQDITAVLKNGASYYSDVWIKGPLNNNGKSVTIDMLTTTGKTFANFIATWSGTQWTKVSGTITPTWTGTLIQSYWHVETWSGTIDFKIDDARLLELDPTLHIVPGTWRREVQP